MVIPSIAAQFHALFQGSSHKHGHSELVGTVKPNGKQEAKCWTADGPATEQLWADHLSGKRGIGIVPIRRGTNDCKFGAIDIDKYKNEETIKSILKQVNESNIPVTVFRSKSGGIHLYLFTSDWVPATLIREKLEIIAAFLGYGGAEIFPAQAILDNSTSDGNWINMPYYGEGSNRNAFNDVSGKPLSPSEFLVYVQDRVLSPTQLSGLGADSKTEGSGDLFPEGPPCLEAIFRRVQSKEITTERNIILFNASVYANLKWPGESNRSGRDAFLVRLNGLFSDPLPLAELNKTIIAQDRKGKSMEYKYQCSKCPLKDHCNAAVCRTRRYGIGAYNGAVVHTLAKVETDPPFWILRINEHAVPLTTEELYMYQKVQQKVLEKTNTLLPSMKAMDWQDVLRDMLTNVHTIRVFTDSSEMADIAEKIFVFLFDNSKGDHDTIDDINSGAVYVKEDKAYFLPDYLLQYLKRKGIDEKKSKRTIEHCLVEHFEAKDERPSSLSPRRRCYVVPAKYTQTIPIIK